MTGVCGAHQGFRAADWGQPAERLHRRVELSSSWRRKTPSALPATIEKWQTSSSGSFNQPKPARKAQKRHLILLTPLLGRLVFGEDRLRVRQTQILQLRQVQLWDWLSPEQKGVVLAVGFFHHVRLKWDRKRSDKLHVFTVWILSFTWTF